MLNILSKKILLTVIYYDILDYPLTSFEIWKLLINGNEEKYSLFDVIKALENDEINRYIEEYRGFYFLSGRMKLVKERIKNNKL